MTRRGDWRPELLAVYGLHPWHLAEYLPSELTAIERDLAQRKLSAARGE